MTGPQDPAAAGGDRFRAGDADREQVIETLKTAFVQGRLTKDELGARAGRALTARTYADLAALTADIPPSPPAAKLAPPPAATRRRPLARATAGSALCLVIAAAAIMIGGQFDSAGAGPFTGHSSVTPFFFLAIAAVVTGFGVLMAGMAAAVEQRSSRRHLPPRPGPGGRALDGERPDGTGHHPVPPGPRPDETRAELWAHQSRRHRRQVPAAVRPAVTAG